MSSYPARRMRLGERAGVTLHIYTRLVSPAEERKILQAADKANRFRGGSTDVREAVEAQNNLEDVSSMIRTAAASPQRVLLAVGESPVLPSKSDIL